MLGVDQSRVNLKAIGKFLNYRGEIHSQSPRAGEVITDDSVIRLNVGFDSVVDHFPHQFFFGLPGLSSLAGGDWEDSGRRLMSTFDAAVIKLEALASYEAFRFSCPEIDPDQSVRTARLFSIDSLPHDPGNKVRHTVLPVLPHFYLWSGNAEGTARFLSQVLGHTVEIVENVETVQQIDPDLQSQLGVRFTELGGSMVLGSSFKERESAFDILVRDVEIDQVADWLPSGRRMMQLNQLVHTTLPNGLDYRIRPLFKKRTIKLGRTSNEAYLGSSATVSSRQRNC